MFDIQGLLNGAFKLRDGLLKTIITLLTTDPATLQGGGWRIVSNVFNALQGIGYGLVALFFLWSLMQKTTRIKELSLQDLVGYFLRLFISQALVGHGLNLMRSIMTIIMGIGGIISNVGNASGAGAAAVPPNIVTQIDALNFGGNIVGFLLGLIAWLCVVGFSIYLVVVVYGRFFKIYINIAIAPLMLSTFAGESTSRTGQHFVKNFIGVCLESCVILLSLILATAIIGDGGIGIIGGADPTALEYVMDYIVSTVIVVVMSTLSAAGANRLVKEMIGH